MMDNSEKPQITIPRVIRIPILSYYGGGYRLEYDGKYITLLGKDKNYKCMFGDDYEEMVLIPIVEEIRNAEPEIIEITDTEIVVSLGCVFNMEIKKTELEEPNHGYNVFVKHTVHYQDFWTRGFLMGNEWEVMTWSGKVKVPKSDIKEWMPIPGIRYS